MTTTRKLSGAHKLAAAALLMLALSVFSSAAAFAQHGADDTAPEVQVQVEKAG
jgi:hypothetical protein